MHQFNMETCLQCKLCTQIIPGVLIFRQMHTQARQIFMFFWQLLSTIAYFSQSTTTFYIFWQLLTSFTNFGQLLATFNNFWKFLHFFGNPKEEEEDEDEDNSSYRVMKCFQVIKKRNYLEKPSFKKKKNRIL